MDSLCYRSVRGSMCQLCSAVAGKAAAKQLYCTCVLEQAAMRRNACLSAPNNLSSIKRFQKQLWIIAFA